MNRNELIEGMARDMFVYHVSDLLGELPADARERWSASPDSVGAKLYWRSLARSLASNWIDPYVQQEFEVSGDKRVNLMIQSVNAAARNAANVGKSGFISTPIRPIYGSAE